MAGQTVINRGWRVAGALSMNLALGALPAWSVLVRPLEIDFGWMRAQTSTVYAIATATFALTFLLGAQLQDRKGPFRVSVTGGALNAIGFFMTGFTTGLPWMYLWLGVVTGAGIGFGYATPIPVMAKWFPDKRGLAVGLAVAGSGGGAAIFGPLAGNWLIPVYGWRNTFFLLGVVFFAMTMIGAFLLQNPPTAYAPEGRTPVQATATTSGTTDEFTPTEVLRTPIFWRVWLAYALGSLASLLALSQIVPLARTRAVASTAIFIGVLGALGGEIVSGWLSDTLGRLPVLRLMLAISAVAMPLLYHTGANVLMLHLLVFVVYWSYGAQHSVNASTVADFWGTRNLGVNYYLLSTAWGGGSLIHPAVGRAVFGGYENLRTPFYIAAVLAAVGAGCLFRARRHEPPAEAQVPA